jgi:chemotaxis methyl-accepting protein methylase
VVSLAFTPMAYRHVVFPDAREGRGYAVNFTPPSLDHNPNPPAQAELTSGEHACIAWLFDRAGLNLADYRFETLKRRIPACLRALRVDSIGDVCTTVERQPDLLKLAISTLVIGVTSFFRDPQVFSVIERQGLTEVLARSPKPRIWSVGCSDGAELYSVAILLAERGAVQRCTLLGTDCRSDAVLRAREGRYDVAAMKAVPGEFIRRYFRADKGLWQIHRYLQDLTNWRQGDAMYTSEPGAWDLILCRNLSIYLQPGAVGRLWMQLAECLRPGGILVTGKAERPFGAAALRPIAPCVYQRERS